MTVQNVSEMVTNDFSTNMADKHSCALDTHISNKWTEHLILLQLFDSKTFNGATLLNPFHQIDYDIFLLL